MAPATAPVWLEAQLKVIQEHKEPRLGVQWLRSGGSQSQAGKPAPLDRFSLRVPYCLGALLCAYLLIFPATQRTHALSREETHADVVLDTPFLNAETSIQH